MLLGPFWGGFSFQLLLLLFSINMLQWWDKSGPRKCGPPSFGKGKWKSMAANVNLLDKHIGKNLLHMALPLMFLNLVNSLYSVVDTFFVGRIGELQVGAVTLVGPVTNCAVAFTAGLSAAALALVSRAIGAGKPEKADETATHLVLMVMISGAVMTLLLFLGADVVLNWLETPAEIYKDSRSYLRGISFDFVGLFMLNLFHAIHQANGDSKSGVRLNSIAAVLNIILDPLFIFGLHMGVLGAALATSLSKLLMVPLVFIQLYRNGEHHMTTIALRRYPLTLRSFKEIMGVTIPASMGQFFSSFGFVLMNKAIIYYGALAMSAYGLGSRIANLFYIPVNSIGGALSAFIGQSLGAQDPQHAKACFKKAMQLCAGISAVITVVGWLISPHILPLFVKDASPELLSMATEYCFFSVATAFFMGWYQILTGVFNGSGHTRSTLFLSVFRLWGCRIPMIYAFRALGFGPTGIWYSMILSNLCCCLAGQALYSTGRWLRGKEPKASKAIRAH